MCTRCSALSAVAVLAAASSAATAGTPSFQPLGDLPGGDFFSQATSVSDDGRYVGGQSVNSTTLSPLIWDGLSPTGLTVPAGFDGAFVNDISGDGQSAVAISPGPDGFRGIRWDSSGTPHVIASDPNTFSALITMDYDGDTAGGFVNQTFFPSAASDAVTWTSGAGVQNHGDIPGGLSEASLIGVTNDGSTFVGYGNDGVRRPVTWDASNGFQVLSTVPSGTGAGIATNIAVDGGTIVGGLVTTAGQMPAYWDVAGVAHLVNLWPGYTVGEGSASSIDGSTIVGNWREDDFADEFGTLAFIWDDVNGARPLQDVLANDYGIDLTGWTLNIVADMTPDGRTFVGTGLNPAGNLEAYKVTIPAPHSVALLGLAGLIRRRRRR